MSFTSRFKIKYELISNRGSERVNNISQLEGEILERHWINLHG